jgi:tetratricopeptide (TPR) repeat protein
MSYPYVSPRRFPLALTRPPALLLLALAVAFPVAAQQQQRPRLPETIKQPSSLKASAYYHYSLGHLYEELAAAGGNRSDYVNKAIENYRLTLKEDPSASFLVEDIAELYRLSGRIREAVEEAQSAIKANPDDLNARRVLARIYTQQIGDAHENRVDEGMVRRALEQYKIISDKDPKDIDSLIMLGRLNRVTNNSLDAEAAFKKALAADPDNEDATTGLASVYADHGDAKSASALLENLTKKSPSARTYATLANSYESMKEYSLAADAYKKALELDSTRTELKAALAQDQALAGKYDDALKTYAEMAEADPKNAQPYLGMAQIYREQKNYEQAHGALNKAKESDPDNLEIRYDEVRLLQEEGKTAEAIAGLKSVLESTSRRNYDANQRAFRAQMLEQLGALYRSNDQYEQAADAFRQVGALDPELMPRAEAQVIDTYRIARDYSKAQAESEAAVKKYPNDRTIHEVRAQLLADQGKADAALAELNKLLDGKNDREVYVAMADIEGKTKRYSEANAALNQAEKLAQTKEDKTNILFMRGAMYERQKKYDEAEKTFRQVLDIDPSNASALNYLGYMLADRNVRLPEAQELIERAVKLEPGNYAFLDSLGWVYFKQNKLPEAEKQLTKSIQLSSKDATIHDHLGDVYFKEGKIKEAIAQWQSSLKEWNSGPASDAEPEDVAKVQKKLDSARVRLAKGPNQSANQ